MVINYSAFCLDQQPITTKVQNIFIDTVLSHAETKCKADLSPTQNGWLQCVINNS